MTKMWRANGEEQKYLEKLFKDKDINIMMKPSVVQQKYPKFQGFSSAVFRKHFNKTRLMFDPSLLGDLSADDNIIEIDGQSPPPAKIPKKTSDCDEVKQTIVEFKQPPVIASIYTCPETKQMKCLVVITLFNDIKTVDFDVISSGDNEQILKVTYGWPKASFDVGQMFTKDGMVEPFVEKMHPKFMSTELALQAVRDNFEDVPVGTIDVKLPAVVQTEPSTWHQYFNRKKDGTVLVFFEFFCHRCDYVIKKKEKSLSLV